MLIKRTALLLALAAMSLAGAALAAEETVHLTIRDHRFEPQEVAVPADTRIKLIVRNADAAPEEFESHSLNRETLIPGGARATIYVGPLAPGTYEFFGEFHQATAQGRIVVE